jgi:hypothetical protein
MAGSNVVLRAYGDGKKEGIQETRQKVLDFLEEEYMNPEVERGSELGEAILDMARRLSELMR